MNEYTIILLAVNLASTLVGNAYYFLRKKFNKQPVLKTAEQVILERI